MKRILFVDDEPSILDGLRNLLRRRRKEWDMAFAPGGEAALAMLREAPFDVVVSDIRMPGMDGVALLKRVQKEFPNAIRIVLSGHADVEATLQAIPVAHQYLSKPVDPERLQNVIERAVKLRDLMSDAALRQAVGGLTRLPSLPQLYDKLAQAVARPDVGLQEIAAIVEQDLAMSAEVLRLVNSAYFGHAQRITTIRNAVSYLGTGMIKNLVLSVSVFGVFAESPRPPGFSLTRLRDRSLLTGQVAARILPRHQPAENLVTAGILHDIGQLVLLSHFPEEFGQAIAAAQARGRPLHLCERELRGVTHAEIGAYLLGLWGFPNEIVEAVAFHHRPAEVSQQGLDLVGAVHVADLLVDELDQQPGPRETAPLAGLDPAYLDRLGAAGEIGHWRELTAALARPE